MNSSLKSRRAILPLTIGLLALGIAVFGWGLHYKLSLYHPKHIAGHHRQAANLLTERERPPAQQVTAVHEPPLFTAVGLSFLPLLYLALDLGLRRKLRVYYDRLQSRQSWRVRVKASFSSFFFRPPPAILPL